MELPLNLLALASINFPGAMAVGYMSTLAVMWGITPNLCYIQSDSLLPACHGNVPDPSPNNVPLWALSGGWNYTCGLEYTSGYPVCWGVAPPERYVPIHPTTPYSEINSGGYNVCALRLNDGNVECWGMNATSWRVPQFPLKRVTTGDDFACGLSSNSSKVVCWGSMELERNAQNIPFDDIFAGRKTVCGIQKETRNTICWGNNDNGQTQPPDVKLVAMTGGLRHFCGLREDTKEAVCWGDNDRGQRDEIPRKVRFATIAAARDWKTCGMELDGDHTIHCWGNSKPQSVQASSAVLGLCRKSCPAGTFEDESSRCLAGSGDRVCVDCSRSCLNGTVLPGSCNGTSDRICVSTSGSRPVDPSSSRPGSSPRMSLRVIIFGATAGAVALLLAAAVALWCYTRRQRRQHDPDVSSRVCEFSSSDLAAATKNYSEHMILGRGAHGLVYRGILPDGQSIAIKMPRANHGAGSSSFFLSELTLLSRLHHAFLVNLLGYCRESASLVFQYMSNGSLFDCLFRRSNLKLDLVTRMKIAAQAARGLEYLHTYASPQIIHRDVKSANILLDENWNAHVADFGLSISGPSEGTHLSNLTVVGTIGYLDPSYFQTLQLNSKSDVYSFGVVLLELLTVRRAVAERSAGEEENEGIIQWVMRCVEEGLPAVEIVRVDVSCRNEGEMLAATVDKALKLALGCTSLKVKERPSMVTVANVLEEVLLALSSIVAPVTELEQPASSFGFVNFEQP